jgi:hypothetical protein
VEEEQLVQAAPPPTPELRAARAKLQQELSRADRAIQRAMAHADEVFGPPAYRGPERRRAPR